VATFSATGADVHRYIRMGLQQAAKVFQVFRMLGSIIMGSIRVFAVLPAPQPRPLSDPKHHS
jgi:hypothetical protein